MMVLNFGCLSAGGWITKIMDNREAVCAGVAQILLGARYNLLYRKIWKYLLFPRV
jgi:hypothetical protein